MKDASKEIVETGEECMVPCLALNPEDTLKMTISAWPVTPDVCPELK